MDTAQPIVAHILFELVADTAGGVRAAVAGGVDRIELCAALAIGGVTPSAGLMRLAAGCGVPTRIMIRPRGGDFIYSTDEVDLMRADIDTARELGLAGVVFGANHPSGELDEQILRALCDHAAGLEIAIHRSFDLAPDQGAALETVIGLGMDTVLTAGGARTAREGVAGLKALVTQSAGRIEILAGIGVTAANAPDIVHLSGVRSVHTSCAAAAVTPATAANDRDWLDGQLRAGQRDTDENLIKAMREALKSIETTLRQGGRQ
jgi:copper homeostasis protein